MILRLRTFGGLSIENATSVGGATANRRPLALLALLAVKGRRGLSRDTLVALFWPESDAEHGRNSLSQAIAVLRREVATDVLLGTTELRINPDVLACDVMEYEDRIAADDLEGAATLYAGPFLDGVFLRNTPEFERWVDRERARLQRVQGEALEGLATKACVAGDHTSAVRLWRTRASLTPNESRAALGLMKALAASGDAAGALAHHRTHRTLLRDEMGVEPDATLTEFAQALQARCGHAAETRAEPPRVDSMRTAPANVAGQTTIAAPSATTRATLPAKRTRALVPLTLGAIALLSIAGAIAWRSVSGRLDGSPPAPPATDSLRLRIVTASVQSDPADSTLARSVRDAVLAELAKDPWLFVLTPAAFVQQAPFIGLSEKVLALPDTARVYARKMRTHAIIDIGVSAVKDGYVLTAEARSAKTDSSLGVIAEAAAGVVDVPEAMTRLGHELRRRLVGARSTLGPTTWSLNTTDEPAGALELYVEGRSEASRRNFIEAARRAKAAVAVDSTFAQAWRLVHTSLFNAGLSVDGQLNAISAAFRFSHRVRAPYWRLDIVSAYYRAIGDPERALVFYDSIGQIAPIRNYNSALAYGTLRRHDQATRAYRRRVDAEQGRNITEANPPLVLSLLNEGKLAEAQHEVAQMVRIDPVNPGTFQGRAFIFSAVREWDSLSVLGKSQLALSPTATDSAPGLRWVAQAAIGRGQFAVYDSMVRFTTKLIEQDGSSGDYLAAQLNRARLRAVLAGDTARARAIADSALGVAHWESLKPMDRPYLAMLLFLASVGDVKGGAHVAQEWSRVTPTEFKRRDSLKVLSGRSELMMASGNAREALRLIRLADVRDCQACFYPRYARAFDAMSEPDSARVWFERYATVVTHLESLDDATELGHTYLRLGEIYEERRDVRAAVSWYERLATLWAASDTPALQAQVRDVRNRVERLRTLER